MTVAWIIIGVVSLLGGAAAAITCVVGGLNRRAHLLGCGCVITDDGVQVPCSVLHDAAYWADMERMTDQ